MRLRLSVDGAQHEVEIVPGDPLRVRVGDDEFTLQLEHAGGAWRVEHADGTHHEVVPGRTSLIDGRPHAVTVHGLALATQETTGAAYGPVRPPMPGRVVKVLVEEGQAVERGTPLVVLEAMKMQNTIEAQGPGKILAVHVRPGIAVEAGQPLVTIGPA